MHALDILADSAQLLNNPSIPTIDVMLALNHRLPARHRLANTSPAVARKSDTCTVVPESVAGSREQIVGDVDSKRSEEFIMRVLKAKLFKHFFGSQVFGVMTGRQAIRANRFEREINCCAGSLWC